MTLLKNSLIIQTNLKIPVFAENVKTLFNLFLLDLVRNANYLDYYLKTIANIYPMCYNIGYEN